MNSQTVLRKRPPSRIVWLVMDNRLGIILGCTRFALSFTSYFFPSQFFQRLIWKPRPHKVEMRGQVEPRPRTEMIPHLLQTTVVCASLTEMPLHPM